MITIMIMIIIILPKSKKKYQIEKLENTFISAKWKKVSNFLCFSTCLISFPQSYLFDFVSTNDNNETDYISQMSFVVYTKWKNFNDLYYFQKL